MEDEQILQIVIGSTIFLLIIYQIIQSATRSVNIRNLNRMQVDLLKEIALKKGVEPEKIEEIIKKHGG